MLEKLPSDYLPHEVRMMGCIQAELVKLSCSFIFLRVLTSGESQTTEDGFHSSNEHIPQTGD